MPNDIHSDDSSTPLHRFREEPTFLGMKFPVEFDAETDERTNIIEQGPYYVLVEEEVVHP